MSSDGGPELGSGGFFGSIGDQMRPSGPYGVWPGCGCGTVLIILAGVLLVCGGVLSALEGMFHR